jgi:hypothetical protein
METSDDSLLFDRYRKPGSVAERDSVHDYDNVELFSDILGMALTSVGLDIEDLAPRVMIDTYTGEIGLAFTQVSLMTKSGFISSAKFKKAYEKFGHHNWVFVSNSYVSCMIPGYASLRLDEKNTPVIAAIFLAGILKKDPFKFPECEACAEDAE